jgi:6,7-dimethyl-8-ribityllumazine synthase
MEENVQWGGRRAAPLFVIALGDVSPKIGRSQMTPAGFAFIKANWHIDIVDRALDGFRDGIGNAKIEVFDVPGAFEIPLLARELARSGRYTAIIGAAFVVDGGIYRHDFVAAAVVDGLMRAQMDADVPVLSVVLTPHNYQETPVHVQFFRDHFLEKGREAARAALAIDQTRQMLVART